MIKEGFRFIINKTSGEFQIAYPKNSKNKDKAIIWETASDMRGQIAKLSFSVANCQNCPNNGVDSVYAMKIAQVFANALGLMARTENSTKEAFVFVFEKVN